MPTGRLLKGMKGLYSVFDGTGTVLCRAGSRLRKGSDKLSAGDMVEFSANPDGTGFITSILPRKNSFVRPAVANVDNFVIVTAAASPDPDTMYIDSLAATAIHAGAEIILVINKTDLRAPSDLLSVYSGTPFRIFCIQADTGCGVGALRAALAGSVSVFAGASGVGKSTLVNALYPGINAETGGLSDRISRGKNTTRVAELYPLTDGGWLADTPGFTMLELEQYGFNALSDPADAYPEFAPYIGHCRYRDCSHTVEEGCAVIDAVNGGKLSPVRHGNYRRMYSVIRSIKNY